MTAIRLTVLADNSVTARNLRGEHGLAFHLACGARHILFDTGQGLVLADNARALGIDLGAVDTVVLSHGHYDHAGGLPDVLAAARAPVTIHLHPRAREPKYRVTGGEARAIGLPQAALAALAPPPARVVAATTPTAIAPGIFCTGEIPRQADASPPTDRFHLDCAGTRLDPLLDDQALYFTTRQGVVALLGCTHAGVIPTLEYIRQLAGQPVRAVLGGLHLGHVTAAEIQGVADYLRALELTLLMPLHCTGLQATMALWAALPDACRAGGVGARAEFENIT